MNQLFLIFILIVASQTMTSQNLSSEQEKFIQKNLKPVSTDSILENANWKSIASKVKNKRIVLLGEFNHGAKEIFQWRNGLIKYLHQHHGFNTILFETGIGELIDAQFNKSELTSAQMKRGLFGVWRTAEFEDLMNYIKTENINLAGFDVQRSGGSLNYILKQEGAKYSVDSNLYYKLEERYGLMQNELNRRNAVYDSINIPASKLISDYNQALEVFKSKTTSSKLHALILKALQNRVQFLNYMLQFVKDRDMHRRWVARDSFMAKNLSWLADSIFPGEKIIVLAHNFHAAKFNEHEQVMGEYIYPKYKDNMYTLAIFGGRGNYANNSGNPTPIKAPDSTRLDVKHLINAMPGYAGFMDLPLKQKPRNQWLWQPITVNDSFIDVNDSNQLILPKYFDGLLFLRSVNAAKQN